MYLSVSLRYLYAEVRLWFYWQKKRRHSNQQPTALFLPNGRLSLDAELLLTKHLFLTVASRIVSDSTRHLPNKKTDTIRKDGIRLSALLLVYRLLTRRSFFLPLSNSFIFGVHNITPAQIATLNSHNQYFRRSHIGRQRNIMHITKAEQS